MINFVLEKLREDTEMKAFFAETYQYIMLDEYQDTNNPQNEIINLICNYNPHLTSQNSPRLTSRNGRGTNGKELNKNMQPLSPNGRKDSGLRATHENGEK